MIPNHTSYTLENLLSRINAILDKEARIVSLPSPSQLDTIDYSHTYKTTIICMAISLPYPISSIETNYQQYQIYKALSSEISALINENSYVLDIDFSIQNKVVALLQLPDRKYEPVIDMAARISSLTRIIDHRARSVGYFPFNVTIGIDSGTCYVTRESIEISNQKELLWMGRPLIEAVRLSSLTQLGDIPIIISENILNNLNEKYRSFFTQDKFNDIYTSSLKNNAMASWMEKNLL